MAAFMPALMNYALRQQVDPASAAEYAKTPEYIGAKTAKDQEVLTKTGALGLAGGLVGGGALGFLGGGAAGAGAVGGEAAGAIGLDPTGLGALDVGFNSAGQLGMTPAAMGIGAGGASALALDPSGLGASDVALNPQGQMGLSQPALNGTAQLAAPATPTQSAAPSAGQPPPGTTGAPPPGTTGMSFTDSLLKQMKDNALGLGLMGAGTAASLSAGRPQIPNQQQLQGLGTEASGIAKQLIGQYQSGALNPNQQASLDQLTQNTKNQLRQYFASIGQGDSTAAAQAMAQVDQTALGMKQQMLDTALQQGLSAIGVAQGPLNTIAQYQLGQDAQLRQAFGNFAGGVGQLFGRNSGVPQPTKPVTSVGAQQPVSSVQSQSPQLG